MLLKEWLIENYMKEELADYAGVIGAVRKPGETLLGMPAIPHRTFMKAYAKFKHAGEEE